jgi:hypothetical protein
MKDLYNNLSGAQSLAPAARAASANGTGVDLQGYDAAVVAIDAGLWTDGTHAFTLEESDALASGYSAVAAADLLGSQPTIDAADEDETVYTFGYRGGKRYVRVVQTVSGATTGMVAGASILRGKPHHAPVT